MKSKNDEFEIESFEIKSEIEQKKSLISNLTAELDLAKKSIEKYKSLYENQCDYKRHLEVEKENMKTEISRINNEFELAEETIHNLKHEFSFESDTKMRVTDEMNSKLNNFIKSNKTYETQVEKLRNEKQELLVQNNSLTYDLKLLHIKLQNEKITNEDMIKTKINLENHISNYKNDYDTKVNQLGDIGKEKLDLFHEKKNLLKERETQEENIKEMKRTYARVSEQLNITEESLDYKSRELEKIEDVVKDLREN